MTSTESYITMRIFCLSMILMTSLQMGSPLSAANQSRDTLTLPEKWLVQPATAPDKAPDEQAWAPSLQGDKKKIHSIWQKQDFTLPAESGGRRVVLDFERIDGDALVFVNGQRVGEVLRPGGWIDVTTAVKWGGENALTVFVTRDYTGISRNFEQDVYRHRIRTTQPEADTRDKWPLGISAPVKAHVLSGVSVRDVFFLTSWREKKLTLEVLLNAAGAAKNVVIEADIIDAEGKPVFTARSQPLALPGGESLQKFSRQWDDPVPWDLDRPYLYSARVRVLQGKETLDELPEIRFGFREVWTEGRQIMMNGHPSRWRLTDFYGADASAISFYRLMGFNVGQIQPHGKLWGVWHDTPLFDTQLLEAADKSGMGIILPAPSINSLGAAFLSDPALKEAYAKEMEHHLRRYRNHPSILAWAVGMNSYNPQSNVNPSGMGRRETQMNEKGRMIEQACAIGRGFDPIRLFYSHADGSVGDVSTANVYLNFVPLQEREEWPMAWAQNGNMPYGAAEFGQPYTANFWKGKQFLLSEYLAMYLGDDAYRTESEKGLQRTLEYGLANSRGHGAMGSVDMTDFPAYWDFQRLFVNNTNRAWRTWGVNGGWLHWLLDMGYGVPPGNKPSFLFRYKDVPGPIEQKPAWANPNFDIHTQANLPLLVWLAGSPVFTDKTHSYFAGEKITKQVAVVWDGGVERKLDITWELKNGDASLAQGSGSLVVKPGEIAFLPVDLVAPSVASRTGMVLALQVQEAGQPVASDSFALEIFPALAAKAAPLKAVVFDPEHKSLPWLTQLGIQAEAWTPETSLEGVDLLIIGREGLKVGQRTPWSLDDLRRGLRVLVLEQTPIIWEQLGFRTTETMPRYVFPRDLQSPILKGLQAGDLRNWRGSPDLLPEGKPAKLYDAQRAPKWTNRHALASVALEIPQVLGFTPILQTEFDLSYSPLLEWRYGRGVVLFSSLDLTSRVGVDPAATTLAQNILHFLRGAALPALRTVYYEGPAGGESLLGDLQADLQPGGAAAAAKDPAGSLLVVKGAPTASLDEYVKRGGRTLYLAMDAPFLAARGYQTREAEIRKVSPGDASALTRAISPSLLRWQDALSVTLFAGEGQPEGSSVLLGGLLLERRQGEGSEVFLQAGPSLLATRYDKEPEKKEAIQLSVKRLSQLVSQVLTNLGASPSVALAERLTFVTKPRVYQVLANWRVMGPLPAPEGSKAGMQKVYEPEQDALEGGKNPNLIYKGTGGRDLDWRRTVDAGPDGFVDLGRFLDAGEDSVAYVTRSIPSDKKRMVRLSVGVDYWLKGWLNGRPILDATEGHGAPKPGAFQVDVLLDKGENIITFKVGAGGKGFGFWAGFSESPDAGARQDGTSSSSTRVSLYQPLFKPFDPYEFHYW